MTAQPFEAVVRLEGNTAILDMIGEINGLAGDSLKAAYTEASGHSPASVVLNFTSVEYINSTGIALIVGVLAQARSSHTPVIAYGLTEHYQQIFRITRLSDFMSIHGSESDALAGSPAAAIDSRKD